jgi:hypothetical protein
MQTLINFLNILYDNLMSQLLCPVKYLYGLIADLIIDLINTIDASELNGYVSAIEISNELGMWFDLFALKESFAIISSAWTIRFAIRRIPFFN